VNALPGVVETQPLELGDARENISTRLALTLPQDITIVGAQTVQVQVGISPIQTSLTLLNQPINHRSPRWIRCADLSASGCHYLELPCDALHLRM
jgi:hypothetical protein